MLGFYESGLGIELTIARLRLIAVESRRLRSIALRNHLDPDEFLPEDVELLAMCGDEKDHRFQVDDDYLAADQALRAELEQQKRAFIASRSADQWQDRGTPTL